MGGVGLEQGGTLPVRKEVAQVSEIPGRTSS